MMLTNSLNMFLTQLQRLLREQDQRARIEYAAHERHRRSAGRAGFGYEPPPYTGTAFDEVQLEIVTWLQRADAMRPQPQSPCHRGPHPRNRHSHMGEGGHTPTRPAAFSHLAYGPMRRIRLDRETAFMPCPPRQRPRRCLQNPSRPNDYVVNLEYDWGKGSSPLPSVLDT